MTLVPLCLLIKSELPSQQLLVQKSSNSAEPKALPQQLVPWLAELFAKVLEKLCPSSPGQNTPKTAPPLAVTFWMKALLHSDRMDFLAHLISYAWQFLKEGAIVIPIWKSGTLWCETFTGQSFLDTWSAEKYVGCDMMASTFQVDNSLSWGGQELERRRELAFPFSSL